MRWLLQESIILRLLFIIGQREKKNRRAEGGRESGVVGIALVVFACKMVFFYCLPTLSGDARLVYLLTSHHLLHRDLILQL
jgi:hypothetical protein